MAMPKLKSLVTIGVLCGAPLVYVFAAASYLTQFAPADGVKTYSQLKAQGVPLLRAVRVTIPIDHYCVFGDATAASWTLPSGPPAYLFDEFGQLVDFTCDVGDSTTFQDNYNVYSGIEVDLKSLEDRFTKLRIGQSTDGMN